ncbi:serine-rich adhesin for platelets isoform X2 [Drosophila takahashii]|uniref:serine-rich adhesin for platelets isoform X2 n=1 Tax=Drosophila takahashii TaxID=29030 RepID=UPI0038992F6D
MPTTKTQATTPTTCSEAEEEAKNCDTPMATPTKTTTSTTATTTAAATTKTTTTAAATTKTHREEAATSSVTKTTTTTILAAAAGCHKPLFFSRRFQDKRNFSSLPLFVYATSPSTHAHSADGVGVAREAAAFSQKNEGFEPATHGISKTDGSCISHHSQSNGNGIGGSNGSGNIGHHLGGVLRTTDLASGAMECLPMSSAAHHPHLMAGASGVGAVSASPTATVVVGATYPHHLHHHHLSHHTPYSNSYGSHHIHSEQTKSLQELQHEVGALLEFRDLVIETFPDLKHKMASMSATPSTPTSSVGAMGGSHSVGGGSSSLATRREWEPGIRMKRKLSHKEPSTSSASAAATSSGAEASSSSLTRSRSNSHSGKKEPKSGENNNGSVVQDSGFSTETSSSKEGHSASSTNGAMTVAIAANRLSCAESDDELLNLLDVIHRKSNRLREEVEQLQSYERQQGNAQKTEGEGKGASKDGMTPQQFREQVERLNREDIKQLRKERDRLLDKLAEMEAETLTGRIKAAKMSDQVEELVGVKKDLEEQLKLAMAQKLELSSRVQQLQQQQQSKSSSSASQSDYSSQRNFLSSATTVLSNGSRPNSNNTFQPVVLDQPAQEAFHQSSGSDITLRKQQQQQQSLGRLDGIVSTPGTRNSKCRLTDSKRFAAILLETNVLELQRHLLTLTVQNQVLAQKLESSSKSKTLLAKRLDKSSEEFEHLRYQLEEKSIELEGTKAQLRLVESRLQANNSTSNSYLHSSQHDYETNRSSASTTLMLSRRGVSDSVDSASTAMPAPPVTQISTPSMKAMVPLAMDELQQHSSSTESAHEHENPQLRTPNSTSSPLSKTMINASPPCPVGSSTPSNIAARVMSISVGGVSPFESGMTPPPRQNAFRKFGSASKPSKIPLPGSKAAAYFSGKPPTGRPSTAGRSPPSAHNSSSTSYGSKSSLSRSTGNLQSLRRADTSASNHSLSTNTSRSSTSSSIPLATTPYSSGSTGNRSQPMAATTPSPRVLQNSPLPKLKRDTISSRVRHLDSLSRAQQSPEGVRGSSTTTSIAAQLSSTLRKDLQLSGNGTGAPYHHQQQHHHQNHRRSGHSPASNSSGSGVSRRYSSASTGGSGGRAIGRDLGENTTPTSSYGGDSDSGKNLANTVEKPNFRLNNHNWQLWQTSSSSSQGKVQMDRYLPHELHDVSEETAYDSYYTEYTTPDSMDCGSANLLVTFDYGYSDSIEARADPAAQADDDDRGEGAVPEFGYEAEGSIWFGTPPKEKKEAKLFEVHHVQHKLLDDSLQSLISYDVDDFEEELSEPEPDEEIFYDSIECV